MFVTKKTIWNTMPLLTDDGMLAIHCNYNNLSHVTEFLRGEDMPYDVLLFHGEHVVAQNFASRYAAAIPFVVVYRKKPLVTDRQPNLVKLKSKNILDEIIASFITIIGKDDLSMFMGEAAIMAQPFKSVGRDVIVFVDDPLVISVLLDEGVSENEVDPWET